MANMDIQNQNNARILNRVPKSDAVCVEKPKTGFFDTTFPSDGTKIENEIRKNHDKALIAWAREGFLDGVKYVAGFGVSQRAMNEALILACESGDFNVIKFLVEEGAKDYKAQVNIDSSLPLKIAVRHRCVEIVDFLISKGAFVNSDYGEALKVASKGDDLLIVKSLVRAGANVSVDRGEIFKNAIHNNNMEMLEFLMSGKPTEDTLIISFYEAIKEKKPKMARVVASNMEKVSPELGLLFENTFNEKFEE